MTLRPRVVGRALLRGRLASDPGLLRLRLAGRATLAVALSSLVLHRLGPAVGLPSVVAMLVGGMVCLNGSFAVSSRGRRDTAVTLLGVPVAAAAGALPATLAAGHRAAHLLGFLVVMVAAVFVRRRGPRWFNYGMLAWLSYFFATFVGVDLSGLPGLLAVMTTATACLGLVAAGLLPDRPHRTRALAHRSFAARVEALAATARDVLAGEVEREAAERRLRGRGYRLVEAALLLDGALAGTDSRSAARDRRALLEAELAAEELGWAVLALTPTEVPGRARADLTDALDGLAQGRPDRCRAAVAALREHPEDGLSDALWTAVAAALRLAHVLDGPLPEPPRRAEAYQPAVELYLGNLPGTASSVQGVLDGRRLAWSMNTRLCVQTAVAGSLALVLGQQLSPTRWYWSVLACFLVLTGTLTTGEVTAKGLNRVLGTVGGLVAATLAVHVTGSRSGPVVAVMLCCVFLGLYFFRVSYLVMAFAVTTLMGELYNVLHELDDALLLLRLAETALGAGVAVAVVLLVLPVRSAAVRAGAEQALLAQLGELLALVRDRLAAPGPHGDLLLAARLVDAKLHQLALVSRPSAGPTLVGLTTRTGSSALAGWTALAYRARSLAAGAVGVAPGTEPELAHDCELLRSRCTGVDAPWPRPEGGSELGHRVDGLARALQAVRDQAALRPFADLRA